MTVEIIRNTLAIVVRNEGEFGTFFVRQGKRKDRSGDVYYCELTIQSSFGNVGYYWHCMGTPTPIFLTQAHKEYLLGKLFGDRSHVFDAPATEKELRLLLLRGRQRGYVTRAQARDLYEAIQDLGLYDDLSCFCDVYAEYANLMAWCSIADVPFRYKLSPQAAGLWEKLWPEFIQALNEEALRPRDIVS